MFMICPLCEQGDLFYAIIKGTTHRIIVCPECDAAWTHIENANQLYNCSTIEQVLLSYNLDNSWKNLIMNDRVDS